MRIRIHGLLLEYWRPKIVFAITSSIGISLYTDLASNKCNSEIVFRHFVRILVDLDLNNDLRYKVLMERKGSDFFIYLKYENLSEF